MTTKIQLKLTNDVLLTVLQMIQHIEGFKIDNLTNALLESIREDLIGKLEEKAKTIQRQTSILDHNKKNAVILKYHEAYTLYKLLEKVVDNGFFADNQHFKRILRLITELDSKVLIFNKPTEDTYQTPLLFNLNTEEEITSEATSDNSEQQEKEYAIEEAKNTLSNENKPDRLDFSSLFEVQKTGLDNLENEQTISEDKKPINKEKVKKVGKQIDIFSEDDIKTKSSAKNTPGQTTLF